MLGKLGMLPVIFLMNLFVGDMMRDILNPALTPASRIMSPRPCDSTSSSAWSGYQCSTSSANRTCEGRGGRHNVL